MADERAAADAAYLVGETKDNAWSVFAEGVELLRKCFVPKIALQKGGNGFGYCGYNYSVECLKSHGVLEREMEDIEYRFVFGDRIINTLTELITVVRFAKVKGWRRIYLVAPPFHQLRSFITAVTAVDHEYPRLKIYNRVGGPLPWNQKVVHSQGVLTGTRLEILAIEIANIQKYQKDGKPYPLVSVERTLEYLEERDRN